MQQLLHQFYTLLPRDERQQCLQQLLASGELTDACDAQLRRSGSCGTSRSACCARCRTHF